MDVVLACAGSWFLGGVPFALLIVRVMTGVDVRTVGSGNVGATNAARALGGGKRGLAVFALVYLLDFGKGLAPTLAARTWLEPRHGLLAPVLVGAAAVLGHCASPYLRFRGGKGVATTTGVFAVLAPVPLLVALAVFAIVRALVGRVFVASLALGVALALAVVLADVRAAFGARLPVTALALCAAAFLFWTHRSNLRGFAARHAARASER